ncbi:ribosome-associated heat shock protein Hsp15 [Gallaecimonas pentaromativorans]|uniref:Heat shock protein 15 n=1 Tax=Gallaecimonas pentaromativorans TaxID=584787 RepID=A0A3N1NJL0_9GAMM|nr:ribosome-associated heat shock protein Hsp15 [Gallaecimonas pentaromativorans]MED5526047.1 ribosome-associated heat shock protein Hsp15 [Pseudomonadota bacterium]ROQ18902.1 heat shock protein Hsp15 [Gallaecimonas pentaromativorans]
MTDKQNDQKVRLDKWLWAARFFKTRSLARAQVEGGKVHYNGNRVKAAKIVEVGALVKLWAGSDEKEVAVLALTETRGPASVAQQLYEETAQSAEKRAKNAEARKLNALYNPHPDSKPDKKQRRQLRDFKHQE